MLAEITASNNQTKDEYGSTPSSRYPAHRNVMVSHQSGALTVSNPDSPYIPLDYENLSTKDRLYLEWLHNRRERAQARLDELTRIPSAWDDLGDIYVGGQRTTLDDLNRLFRLESKMESLPPVPSIQDNPFGEEEGGEEIPTIHTLRIEKAQGIQSQGDAESTDWMRHRDITNQGDRAWPFTNDKVRQCYTNFAGQSEQSGSPSECPATTLNISQGLKRDRPSPTIPTIVNNQFERDEVIESGELKGPRMDPAKSQEPPSVYEPARPVHPVSIQELLRWPPRRPIVVENRPIYISQSPRRVDRVQQLHQYSHERARMPRSTSNIQHPRTVEHVGYPHGGYPEKNP